MIKWGDVELPGFDWPLRAVGKKRRRIFAAFLEKLIGEVSCPRGKPAVGPKLIPESTMFADACRTCRGHCCSKGGNDAYLGKRHPAGLGSTSAFDQTRSHAALSGCHTDEGVRGFVHLSRGARMQPAAKAARTDLRRLSLRSTDAAGETLNAGLSRRWGGDPGAEGPHIGASHFLGGRA